MKAIILKPVVWNTEQYIKPSGYKASSGFAKDNGYGHEEWNNSPNNIWREQQIFHTETTKSILEYSFNGELGIIPIASHNKIQYALGIATNVLHNTEDEKDLICQELNIYERGKELWSLENVRKCFQNDKNKFFEQWKKNYKWINWRCPVDHFHWFTTPIPLDPENISGKQRLASMHGSFQAITPFIALEIVKSHLPIEHSSPLWLTAGEFDEQIIKDVPENKKVTLQKVRKKFKIESSNATTQNSFEYWVAGKRNVNPHHATLQAKFVKYLHEMEIQPIEDKSYIDVQYSIDDKLYYSEIKPTETVESKYAIRAAIGQLLEYQYTTNQPALLEIVIGKKPKKDEIDFVKSIGMKITYYSEKTNSFVSIVP